MPIMTGIYDLEAAGGPNKKTNHAGDATADNASCDLLKTLPPALLPPEELAELAALSAAAAAAALRPPMSTGLNTEVFRLAAPLGLLKLAAAACTAAPRPSGRPTGSSEAPMDFESRMLEAEDTGEPLSMPTGLSRSKMHKISNLV